MALPSQSERSNELGRSHVYKRPRRQPATMALMITAGVVVLFGAVWAGLTFMPGEPNAANATSAPADPAAEPKPAPSTPVGTAATKPAPAKPEPAPVVLRQQTTPPTSTPAPGTSAAPKTISTPNTPTPAPGALTRAIEQAPARTDPGSATPTGGEATKPALADPSSLVVEDPSKAKSQPAATPADAGAAPSAAIPPSGSTQAVRDLIAQGQSLISSDPLKARAVLSRAYPDAASTDQQTIRDALNKLNADLLFSKKVTPGDPLVTQYTVESGDSLVRIARRQELAVDWRLIQRINAVDPARLRVGQKLKLVRGPFHAVVDKSEYRLDLFHGSPDDPRSWLFIRSFTVGLGEGNSTPPGTFVIRKGSKLVNPPWVNPRTGEKYAADDPKNPIGEHWLGFEGVGESAALTGYGLHGTIDPDSIGKQRSMGCVRLGTDDIALIYEMLEEQVSVVRIVP